MTLASASYLNAPSNFRLAWGTELDASDSTPKESPGSVRTVVDPVFGYRQFEYVQFSYAAAAGEWVSKVGVVALASAASGTTTSVTTTGLTANAYQYGLLRCKDDAGAAGAAPEGEIARIIENSTTVIYVNAADAFSVAPAVGDAFDIILPHRVEQMTSGDMAVDVRGVSMVTQTTDYWGWAQFYGLCPIAKVVAAGTVVTGPKGVIAGSTGLATVSSTSAESAMIGFLPTTSIATDQVLRTGLIHIACSHAKACAVTA
jgi:hypothetical protein